METKELSPDTLLSWQVAPGVAGYRVRVRKTHEARWTAARDVGLVDRAVLKGLSKDDWLFAVEAYGPDGAASLPVYPQVAGR